MLRPGAPPPPPPHREQQRVAGQERRHHQPRLAEHDREQQRVHAFAVGFGELAEVFVQMQDVVDQPVKPVHAESSVAVRRCYARCRSGVRAGVPERAPARINPSTCRGIRRRGGRRRRRGNRATQASPLRANRWPTRRRGVRATQASPLRANRWPTRASRRPGDAGVAPTSSTRARPAHPFHAPQTSEPITSDEPSCARGRRPRGPPPAIAFA